MSQVLSLHDPVRIGGLDLPNRVIMAPLTRSRAGAAGVPGALNVEYYVQRASAGLIITEATNVGPLSCAFEYAPGIWRPDQVAGWHAVAEAVHSNGGHMFLQLWHGGRVSAKGLLDGREPVSPSGVNDDLDALEVWAQLANGHYVNIKATPSRALSTGEVEAVIEEYRVAAVNAKAAGFDGIEIHAANGYLPHQFLSSATNQRTDRYGGSVENRVRFLHDIVDAAISAFPPDRVGVRLSPYAPYNHALDDNPPATYSHAAAMLQAKGLGYIHLADTAAFATGKPAMPQILRDVKPHFKGSIIVNGGISPAVAARMIADGSADAIAFGRLFIANPDLPERIRIGADLNEFAYDTAYGGGAHGYTDYAKLNGR
ncbi:alkene reductase [Lichenifustis flavocetrariae]|uniref:Alkene reductase n=1 Tax=Lichenifustis flavocetrariae TaxID=2949735 RepID=A0AA41YXL3_9HYPH|nr:alkene reductase [Lichenifustis flavocetrariae]MCW6508878.1 alkene reductase [Lichenifustis flavocetrariae]